MLVAVPIINKRADTFINDEAMLFLYDVKFIWVLFLFIYSNDTLCKLYPYSFFKEILLIDGIVNTLRCYYTIELNLSFYLNGFHKITIMGNH
jgi:hypothetical protein